MLLLMSSTNQVLVVLCTTLIYVINLYIFQYSTSSYIYTA